MKSLNSASIVIFLLFYPLYSRSSITTGKSIKLPQRLVLKVIKYIVPNLVSPKHPEEIEYQDKQLNSYRSVCKEWQRYLDRRLTFKDLEQLFIVNYHWPWQKFKPFCKNYFEVLERSSIDQRFVIEQQKQIKNYELLMLCHNEITKNSENNDETEMSLNNDETEMSLKNHETEMSLKNDETKMSLKVGIQDGFYSHLYDLLLNKKYDLWQELFEHAIEMAEKADKENALKYLKIQNQKQVITICKNQYLRYLRQNERENILENFLNKYCNNELNDNFFKNKEKSPLFLFDHIVYVESETWSFKVSPLKEYMESGGFITQSLYKAIFKTSYFTTSRAINEPVDALSKVLLDWNLNVFLGVHFAIVVVSNKGEANNREIFCKFKKILMMRKDEIDYQLFFSSFMNMYNDPKFLQFNSEIKKHFLRSNFQIKQFFNENSEWLLKRDKNNKTFLYYLLLLVAKERLPYYFLKFFINIFPDPADHIAEMGLDEKSSFQSLFRFVLDKNTVDYGLTKSDQIILEKIIGVKRQTRSQKMKSLLIEIVKHIANYLYFSPSTSDKQTIIRIVSFQITLYFGLCLLMKILGIEW